MPVRQYNGANDDGPSSSSSSNRGSQQGVKPRVKPEPFNDNVIDLCDSDDDQTPRKPSPPASASRLKRPAARGGKLKHNDDGSSSPDSSTDSEDDFRGSGARRRITKSASSSSTTAKLYALARIVTLATDGVASTSESTVKLASVSSGILSRIQKSLALAKHPGTGEAEAQQALRLATRLMSSQNLTQADLLASSDSSENQTHAGMSIVEIVSQTGAAPRNESWVNQVACAINLFFDVKAYSTSYANRTKLSWTFYGLAVNTVAAAHAFEMVHNQVLTWATEKAATKQVTGKTGKNSYCQGVAAGLIALAKGEKKEEMRLAIESEKKRLKDAEVEEKAQIKKEKQRLNDPPVKLEEERVKPDPRDDGGRNVKLEDVADEADIKPFPNGVKRSASADFDGYSRWTDHDGSSDTEDFHDPFPPFAGDDIKPHFDETLERDIIDLTDDLDSSPEDVKPDVKPKPEPEDIKSKPEPEPEEGAGWHSSNQLIRFRQDAERIADDYLASQHADLKFKKRAKSTFKKDSGAFEQGRADARKIDVKRKRIQA
ncbi:protein of unknown function DUF2786 [Kalmanozyma brasiliensis GHG001]|uniref:Uncharacterized protein n=1 Tax=Kalmanozyma brasiliensis (strain GHG001) TaxID=1365824 RepID=V5E4N1_KALBG|nr:protein of unknown function DUF2786 [Kalmanozyma brasiliensis GHG001]EST05146.1 protein of unknown function DUF2786 [Kalmanozyma brasiliensis GHG001]